MPIDQGNLHGKNRCGQSSCFMTLLECGNVADNTGTQTSQLKLCSNTYLAGNTAGMPVGGPGGNPFGAVSVEVEFATALLAGAWTAATADFGGGASPASAFAFASASCPFSTHALSCMQKICGLHKLRDLLSTVLICCDTYRASIQNCDTEGL